MTAWYRTRWHDSYSSAEVKEVDVVKTTDACVYLSSMQGRRLAKRSSFENFFESRDEAVEFVRASLRSKRDWHQMHADRYAEACEKFA